MRSPRRTATTAENASLSGRRSCRSGHLLASSALIGMLALTGCGSDSGEASLAPDRLPATSDASSGDDAENADGADDLDASDNVEGPTTATADTSSAPTTSAPPPSTSPPSRSTPSTSPPSTSAPSSPSTSDDTFGATTTEAPTDASTTSTTEASDTPTTAPSTTASSTTVVSTEPTTEAERLAEFGDEVRIVRFDNWVVVTSEDDDLNVREDPDPASGIVVSLEHLSDGLSNTATGIQRPDGSVWVEVITPADQVGWVNATYIAKAPPTSVTTAACIGDTNFPTDAPLTTVQSDVDGDGGADTVTLVGDFSGATVSDNTGWVRVAFANGGFADGSVQGFEIAGGGQNPVVAMNLDSVNIDPQELLIAVGANSSGNNYVAMALNGCTWSAISGDAALVNHSSVGTVSSFGCEYGAHGDVEVSTFIADNNAGTWTLQSWRLQSGTWVFAGAPITGNAGPSSHPSLDPCAPGL